MAIMSHSDIAGWDRSIRVTFIDAFRISFLKTISGNKKAAPFEVVNPGVRRFKSIRPVIASALW
jgi:hypothetical protein